MEFVQASTVAGVAPTPQIASVEPELTYGNLSEQEFAILLQRWHRLTPQTSSNVDPHLTPTRTVRDVISIVNLVYSKWFTEGFSLASRWHGTTLRLVSPV